MILQLISARQVRIAREHIIQRLISFADDLRDGDETALKRATEQDVTEAELREAAEKLAAEAKEDTISKSNEEAFIPSSPWTCTLQAVLEEEAVERGFIDESDALGLAAGQVPLSSTRLKNDKIDVLGLNGEDAKQGLSVGDMEDGEDIRYAVDGALGVLGRFLGGGRHKFNKQPAKTAALGDNARVLLFGDWASGLDRARDLANVIADMAINDDAERVQHLVHLGDTYYAGRSWEYTKRFLPYWPNTNGRAATQWSLNGNHDMYSGGKGYFVTLLQNELFKSHRADPQKPESASSFFLLENDDWQIFGLDSAYDSPQIKGMDGAINDAQVAFVKQKLDKTKRVILLTHHQLFSARANEGNSKQIKGELIKAGVWSHIDAWIWGHEHRCVVYKRDWTKQHHDLPFAMCLGNSGVPVKDEPIVELPGVEWEYTESFEFTQDKRLRQFAFASLLFDKAAPKKVKIIIYDWKGKPVQVIEL